ncbi:MAG: hypothetical protein Q3M30_06370 [Candidatus Electrothrix sp. Rat3]|nr:hypothetical protein [Candidatus Electrothrix rattekaaiensis]
MTKNSLKYYQNLKNSLDTAFNEGRAEGKDVNKDGKRRGSS